MTKIPAHRFFFDVCYADTDAGAVIYHARYLEIFERARFAAMAAIGLDYGQLHAQGYVFPVVEMMLRFSKPGRLGDRLRVETELVERKRATLRFVQKILREKDEALLCEVKLVAVCLGPNWKASTFPKEMLKKLEKAEKGS